MTRTQQVIGWAGRNFETLIAFVALLWILTLAMGSGCCSQLPDRSAAAEEALEAWDVIRRATVPDPRYGDEERAELEAAEQKFEAALFRLAREEGAR